MVVQFVPPSVLLISKYRSFSYRICAPYRAVYKNLDGDTILAVLTFDFNPAHWIKAKTISMRLMHTTGA